MEYVLALLALAAVALVVRYALKKERANDSTDVVVQPAEFVKEEVSVALDQVKSVLDVNNDGKVDLGDAKEVVTKTKKAIKTTKATVKKTRGRKPKESKVL